MLSSILKIIDWLKSATEKGTMRWEMKRNGMLEGSSFGYTFSLVAAEFNVPESSVIEVPGAGGGRAFTRQKVIQLFISKGDSVILHAANFLHPTLDKALSELAELAINQVAATNEERIKGLLAEIESWAKRAKQS